jgi:hypothetical protein
MSQDDIKCNILEIVGLYDCYLLVLRGSMLLGEDFL